MNISKIFKIGVFALATLSFQNLEAAKSNRRVFSRKQVKVYVFKNGSPFNSKETLVAVKNDEVVHAGYVSTGMSRNDPKVVRKQRELEAQGKTGRIWTKATKNGYYTFDEYDFDNETTPGFRPANALVFLKDSVRIPRLFGDNIENGLEAGKTYDTEQAIHDSAPVTGSPASHGCIRHNQTSSLKVIIRNAGGLSEAGLYVTNGSDASKALSSEQIEAVKTRLGL